MQLLEPACELYVPHCTVRFVWLEELGNILDMFHKRWRRPRIDEFQQDKACSLAGLPDPETSLWGKPDTALPHSLPSFPLDMSHIASPPLRSSNRPDIVDNLHR